jgi:hypothetical protein
MSEKHKHSNKVLELQNQILLLTKEVDEMKRQYGRVIEINRQQERQAMHELSVLKNSVLFALRI